MSTRLSIIKRLSIIVAAVSVLAASNGAQASMLRLHALLKGTNEIPPNGTSATGELAATLDTVNRELTWEITVHGLSSRVTAAHFRGPAKPNENGEVVIGARSHHIGFSGSATLSDEEAKELVAGLWYLNIDTEAFPHGEIRGQVVRGH
jgi:hypothetical protein